MRGPSPIRHFPVGKSIYEFVQELTNQVSRPNYHCFCHLLASTLIKLKDPVNKSQAEVWIFVPADLFTATLRGTKEKVSPPELVQLGLLETAAPRPHDYKIADWILDKLTPLLDIDDKEVDLFTGKPVKRASVLVKKNHKGVVEPALIRGTIDAISECRFNWAAIKAIIRGRKAQIEAAQTTADYRSLQGKYLNDYYCFKAVRRQQPNYLGQGVFWYRPPYRAQKTGRIGHLWGGLQTCSSAMKYAAYLGIADLYNYQLRFSQGWILKQQYETVGLDTRWLDAFLQKPEVRLSAAKALGISELDLQQALEAAVLGTYWEEAEMHSVYRILSWTYPEHAQTLKALNQFLELIAPLQLQRWHQLLVEGYYTLTGYKQRGKRYLYNPTGKRLCIENIPPQQQPKELAEFILHGQEAAFNHWICLLGVKYGYQVMSHEHSGVVTLGKVPPAAMTEAQTKSGLKYSCFEPQPILTGSSTVLETVNEWLLKYSS